MSESGLFSLIFFLSISFILVLFFIFRWVVLWYYKIDERVSIMKETNELIRIMIDSLNNQKN